MSEPHDATSGLKAPVATPPSVASAHRTIRSNQLRRLWEPPTPPRRGPRPALTLTQITQAAIGIADADGLAAVSMARVAKAVGYTPMALYRYVDSKEELYALMADAAAGPPPVALRHAAGWRAKLELWTRAQIDMIVNRPWYIELPLSSTQPGPNRVAWIEAAFAALAGTGLRLDEKFEIAGMLAQHVLGQARVEVETRRAAAEQVRLDLGLPADTPVEELDPAALEAANPFADMEVALARYADPAQYPALLSALAEVGFTQEGAPGAGEGGGPAAGAHPTAPGPTPLTEDAIEDHFGWALAIVLDGVEVFINRHRAGGPA